VQRRREIRVKIERRSRFARHAPSFSTQASHFFHSCNLLQTGHFSENFRSGGIDERMSASVVRPVGIGFKVAGQRIIILGIGQPSVRARRLPAPRARQGR